MHDVEGENDPPPLALENDTVPVGVVPPDTVAVQVDEDEVATLIELGMQLMYVLVDT